MGIIAYFAATQKELLFGAPSFLQPEEVAEAQIQEEKKIIPAVSDSMKADTMQAENAAPQTPESTWKK